MILSAHQPQYLPWIGYFDKIKKSDIFIFLDNVQYKHREFQNRNKIRTRNGWMWLTVPVIIKGKRKQNLRDVAIDNSSLWTRAHMESIRHCYARAPFFDKHKAFFENTYSVKWEKLIELNIHIIKYLLTVFKIKTALYYESELGINAAGTDRIIEIAEKFKIESYLSGIGGKDYLEEEKFKKAGIKLEYQNFVHPVYNQQFSKDRDSFIPYMSSIDLLFNGGTV